MAEEQTITIEVDGQILPAKPGQMLIEVTDAAGITVPRFCYHKHLSVAANCRMCLVEVEKAPKPLPACATPCMDGMKVFTRSPLARAAQKGTMEFLLINHPLDCPICDQGGECELQDVAMGYGGDVSRFTERKRVVRDEDLGALIATDMTRCIHCTRCVRFGGEIAGLREMGATGRGEHMRIGVFIEHSVASELSGNIIDLCPVGALTSKPSRFTARAWELTQHDTVSPHDGVGSNLHLHVRRNEVMRTVPRENDALNQTWISDRDRFGYAGVHAEDRLRVPMIRDNGKLREADWDEALQFAAGIFKDASGDRLGTLVSPNATLEEMYLAAQLTRGLGANAIDSRLRQTDFRADSADPALPWLGQKIADVAENNAVLLVGSWLRKDQPMLNHRVRSAVLEGAVAMAINPVAYDFNYDLDVDVVCAPSAIVDELAGVAAALGADTCGVTVEPDKAHQAIADELKAADKGLVLLGAYAQMHPDFSLLRQLTAAIASAAGVDWGQAGFGANDGGAWMAGAVPHRLPGGTSTQGGNLEAMLGDGLDALLMLAIEPEHDTADANRMKALLQGARVVSLSSYMSPLLEAHADVLLPIAVYAETSGSYVTVDGQLQSFPGAVSPQGEARPAWKVLRVLGNLADIDGFDYIDSMQIRDEVVSLCSGLSPDNTLVEKASLSRTLTGSAKERISGVPMYNTDAIVRRSGPLQHTPDSWGSRVRINAAMAADLAVQQGDQVTVTQSGNQQSFTVVVDDGVPDDCVWLPLAIPGSETLGGGFGEISVEKA